MFLMEAANFFGMQDSFCVVDACFPATPLMAGLFASDIA
jgi:hypothetical protein